MAKGIIQYTKDLVNDSVVSTTTTYSSNKIEQLLSTISSDMYMTNDILTQKEVGNTQIVNQSDLGLTPTSELKLNQIVYDKNRILGKIVAIDSTALTVEVETIHSNVGEGGCEIILGCFDTAPTTFNQGDMYYNTANGKIYTADTATTWDTGNLPTEKIIYLNLDDKKIYAYTNNQFEIYGGSEIQISSRADNALTEIPSGVDKGLYVKDLEAKLNQISSIQRVNIENAPEYILIYTRAGGTPTSRSVSQGTYNVTSWHNDLETNMDSSRYDVTSANGYVILKKGITYELEFSTLSDSLGASYYIRNEAGQNIGNRGYMSANLGKWSDESIKGIYTPEKDEKITFEVTYQTQFAAKQGTTTTSTTGFYYMDCSHIFVRQLNPYVVDPVEHVNIDKGLEDTPVGHIMTTAGESSPPHYLKCDGTIYNIADYPYLSEYFKTELGAYNCYGGDGITTFAVPNIKDIEKLDTTSIANNAWASSIYSSNYPAAKAFNGILDTNSNYWQTVASPSFPVEIGIDLESGYVIKKYVLHNYGWSAGAIEDRPVSWTFEGSNDKTDWDILDTQTNYTWTTGKEEFNIANVRPYRYYRFIITATVAGQKSPILNQVELFVNTENPSHIKYEPTYFFNVEGDVTYEYGCETILGCFATAPAITAINDMYYNTTNGRIYTSVDGISWDTGTYPQKDILYVSIDDKKIYAYTNNQFEVYGGNTLISPKADNALEEIADGTNDGLYVKDLSVELTKLNWAQKTVNEVGEFELLDAPVTFNLTPATTQGASVSTDIYQDKILLDDITNYDYIDFSIRVASSTRKFVTQTLRVKVSEIVFNNSNTLDLADGSHLNLTYDVISTHPDVGGEFTLYLQMWFKDTKTIYLFRGYTPYTQDYTGLELTSVMGKKEKSVTIDPLEYANETKGIEDTPIGHIMATMANTAPKHYLKCDGTIYNILDYRHLAEHIKTEFGSYNYFGGDGTTTFAVPDLRGEFLRGTGTNTHTNQGSGLTVGTHQDSTTVPAQYQYYSGKGGASKTQFTLRADDAKLASDGNYGLKNHDGAVPVTGNILAMSIDATKGNSTMPYASVGVRPTNTSVLYCIKYEPTYFMKIGEGGGFLKILGCFDTAPTTFSQDDMYYNTIDNKIYNATDSTTWDSGVTPDEEILYLALDNNKIYNYNNGTLEVFGGSETKISTLADNAIQDISNGMQDGLYVKDLEPKLDSIKKWQKYLNSDLEYCDAVIMQTETLNYKSTHCPLTLKFDTVDSNMDFDQTTGNFTLKAGKRYEIIVSPRVGSNKTISGDQVGFQATFNIITASGDILGNAVAITNTAENNWSGKDFTRIVKFDEDTDIYVTLAQIHNTTAIISSLQMTMTIKEVGQMVEIDPVEYVNEESGIEDTPVGSLLHLLEGASTPKHYLACDGSVYNIADYPYLVEHIKTEFGSYNYFGGDGTTTFAVPSVGVSAGEVLYSYTSTGNKDDEDAWQADADCSVTYTLSTGLGYNAVLYIDNVQVDMSNPNVPNVSTSNTITVNKGQTLRVECGDAITTIKAISLKTVSDHFIKYEPTYFMNLTAKLEKDILTNVTVGGIKAGTLLPEGMTFTEFVEKLLVQEQAPTGLFNATGSGIIEVGDTSITSSTLVTDITSTGTSTINSIEFYQGTTLLDTQNYVDGTTQYTYNYANPITSDTTFKTVINYTKSDGTTDKVEYTKSFKFVYASYYGAVNTLTPTVATITLLNKDVKNSKSFTYNNVDLTNERFCYAYPKSFGDLTSIKDANNFEYLGSYTKTVVQINTIDYNVYILTDPVTGTGFKQIYN